MSSFGYYKGNKLWYGKVPEWKIRKPYKKGPYYTYLFTVLPSGKEIVQKVNSNTYDMAEAYVDSIEVYSFVVKLDI